MGYVRCMLAAGLWLLCTVSLYGQYNRSENNVWAFGTRAGLDFNSGAPVPLVTAMHTEEGTASVCDAQGALLFYTNGDTVWNRNHAIMPNGAALAPGTQIYSTTQAAVIVPVYGQPDRWYVFTLGASWYAGSLPPGNSALSYSVVDMTLDNGLGDVVPGMKNIPLDQYLSERMITVPGTDCRIWLVAQTRDSFFKAWAITEAGLNTTPVVSRAGFVYPDPMNENAHLAGVLKVTQDGRKLAGVYGEASRYFPAHYPIASAPGIQLFDFDPATGIVSNAQTLTTDPGIYYGAAFSPDNSKLYVCVSYVTSIDILQYDLNAGPLIPYSRLQIATNTNAGRFISDIRLAPDGRIYIPADRTIFDRINMPDLRGSACQYERNAVSLPAGVELRSGLPNQVNLFPVADSIYTAHDVPFCYRDSQLLYAPPGAIGHRWQDGSRDSFFVVRDTGTYVVQSLRHCVFLSDTFRVLFPDTVFSRTDTTLCPGRALLLTAPQGRDEYLWDNLAGTPERAVDTPGSYYVYSSRLCQPYVDSFNVRAADIRTDLPGDTVVCDSPPVTLKLNVPGAAYRWPDGSTGDTWQVPGDGSYRVAVTKDGCTQEDSIRVTFVPVAQRLGNDTTICRGDRLTLHANVPAGASVTWSDGSTAPAYTTGDTGLHWVTVQLAPCTVSDTLHLASEACSCRLFIPDAFTPNGDGRNDFFRPVFEAGCPVNDYTLYVYNRWGILVYEDTDPASGGWDGTWNGAPATVGVYMYYASFRHGSRQVQETRKGDLTLVR